MEDKIIGFKINSKGYGTVPKLLTQDRNICIGAKGLYAYFCSYTGGGDTCFPSRKKVCYDLCISIGTFGKYLKQLVEHGYIKVEQVKENGRFSYNVYTLCDTILPCTNLPCTKISDTVISVYEKIDTNNNSNNNNNNNNNNNSKKERKKASKANTKKDNAKSFNDLIDNYTQNEQLRAELKEHLKTRKSKKSALTNRAIELSLKKLDDIAETDEEKILIVQNAIMRGWTGFFPLKDSDIPAKRKKQQRSYDLEEIKNFNIFADEESKEEADEYSKYYDYDMADFYKSRQ